MKSKIIIITITGTLLLLTGCHKFFGGGWFYGQNNERITFSINARCIEDAYYHEELGTLLDVYHEGRIQYRDKDNGVHFIGKMVQNLGAGEPSTCDDPPIGGEDFSNFYIEVIGDCHTLNGKREGTFRAYLEDNGSAGLDTDDFISMDTNCTADGSYYHNEGYLEHGNVVSLGH